MNKFADVIPGSQLFVKEVMIEGDKLTRKIREDDEDSYLLSIPTVQQLMKEPIRFNSRVTFLIGENGVGKSTIIEAIASSLGFNPEDGDKDTLY